MAYASLEHLYVDFALKYDVPFRYTYVIPATMTRCAQKMGLSGLAFINECMCNVPLGEYMKDVVQRVALSDLPNVDATS